MPFVDTSYQWMTDLPRYELTQD